jgi:REP element-mobilizing transposase RayT
MPPRPPIDPEGAYHVGTRGVYGQPLFRSPTEYELFLSLYTRVARKYGWITLEWVLMVNHHHFVLKLTDGGLSDGMRELHGGFSRRIHAIYGLTNQGHLVRHGFFARLLESDEAIIAACRYVDLNPWRAIKVRPGDARWCGYGATVGDVHPRPFHNPNALLELISPRPAAARAAYRALIDEALVSESHDPSPNEG